MKIVHREYPLLAMCGLSCGLCTMHLGGYCPGCGGTRALTALAHGQVVRSMYYHPAVPFAAVSAGGYLASLTVWRLRGRRARVLRWDIRWLYAFLALLAANCALRNLLWFGFGIPLA